MSAKSNPLACPCGRTAKLLHIAFRNGRREQIACECGRQTIWVLCSPNGEHRQDLLHEWRKLAAPANTCTTPQGRGLSGKEVAG